jgi:hypothetical protein
MGLLELLQAVIRTAIDGLHRNKLPATLSTAALLLTAALAATSDYDERPRYRNVILPEIRKAEQQFFTMMLEAEQERDEAWRLQYFLEAHRRAKMVLRVIRSERPLTAAGRRAQAELARYYALVDEELAIIRTEMSLNPSYDYIGEWKRRNAELMPLRNTWQTWVR